MGVGVATPCKKVSPFAESAADGLLFVDVRVTAGRRHWRPLWL